MGGIKKLSKIWINGIIMILLFSLSIYAAQSASSKTIVSNTKSTQKQQIKSITMWEGFKHFRSGDAVFLDARSRSDYYNGHIPGAYNISIQEDMSVDARDPKLKSKMIIAYCLNPQCPLAEELAKKLVSKGFTNVNIMPDGWKAWFQSGYPVESGM